MILTAKRSDSTDLSDQHANRQVGPPSAVNHVEQDSLSWWMRSKRPDHDCDCKECHDMHNHGNVGDDGQMLRQEDVEDPGDEYRCKDTQRTLP